MQHDKVNFLFFIVSDILLYVDGKFEYVVCLYLYHLSYQNYPTFCYRMRTNSWLAIFTVSEIWTKDPQQPNQE